METAAKVYQSKKTNLFIILSGIFLTNAILAEIIGVKIFSGEMAVGVTPVNWVFFGDYVLDFNLTAGAVIWPIVFITTDIINEYYGKKGVRKISFITASFIGYVFIIILLVTQLPPADFWLKVNSVDKDGNPFNIDFAFNIIFRRAWG
jgi:queuosine precursor transporter